MNILFTAYFPLGYGGAEISMVELARALKKRGHTIIIASTGNYPEFQSYLFKRVKNLPYIFQEWYIKNFLSELIKKENIDVVHAHDRLTAVPAILAAKKENRRVVVHFRDYWFACPKSTCFRRDGVSCRGCEAVCLVKCSESVWRIPLEGYKILHLKKIRGVLNGADVKIANSIAVKQSLLGQGIKDPIEIIHPLRGEVKGSVNEKEVKKKYQLKRRVIVFSGSLEKTKGMQVIAPIIPELMKEYGDLSFVVIGDGSLRKEIERLSEGKAMCLGKLSHDETLKVMSVADIIVLPSLWEEPFSGVILEAGLLGKPLIASKVGGIKDLDERSYLGIKNPKNQKEWREKIGKLIKEPMVGKAVVKRAKQIVEQHVPEKIAERVEKTYLEDVPTREELLEFYKQAETEIIRSEGLGEDLIPKDASFRARMRATRSLIKEKKNETLILDLGCGIGLYDFYLLREIPNASILGIDVSQKQIRVALELCKKADGKRIAFKEMDIEKIEEGDLGGFKNPDYIIATEILEHFVDPRPLLRKIKSFCASKTRVILSMPLKYFNEKGNVWYIQHFGGKSIDTQDLSLVEKEKKYYRVWHKEYTIPEILKLLDEEGFAVKKMKGSLFRPFKTKNKWVYSAMSKLTLSYGIDNFLNRATGNKFSRTVLMKCRLK